MKFNVTITDGAEKVHLTFSEDEIQIFMCHVHWKNYDGSYVMSDGRIAEVKEVA